MFEIYAQAYYLDEQALKDKPADIPGPTEPGWYILIGSAERALVCYPQKFKTEEEANAAMNGAVQEFIESQFEQQHFTVEERILH